MNTDPNHRSSLILVIAASCIFGSDYSHASNSEKLKLGISDLELLEAQLSRDNDSLELHIDRAKTVLNRAERLASWLEDSSKIKLENRIRDRKEEVRWLEFDDFPDIENLSTDDAATPSLQCAAIDTIKKNIGTLRKRQGESQ